MSIDKRLTALEKRLAPDGPVCIILITRRFDPDLPPDQRAAIEAEEQAVIEAARQGPGGPLRVIRMPDNGRDGHLQPGQNVHRLI